MAASPPDYCAAQVRRLDYDRYLTVLFAPAARRTDLFALYAFNSEIAKIRETVTEALIGRIRLQWWRDAVAEIFDGKTPRPHEIVAALAAAIARRGLPRAPFDALLDARERDLDPDPPPTLADLADYATGTSARLAELAARSLGEAAGPALAAARAIGTGWALTGLIRAIPFHARAKRQWIPADLAARHGLKPGDLFELRATPALRHCVTELVAAAGEHLDQGRSLGHGGAALARPIRLQGRLAEAYLRQIEKADGDVIESRIGFGRAGTVARLLLWSRGR